MFDSIYARGKSRYSGEENRADNPLRAGGEKREMNLFRVGVRGFKVPT